MIRMLVLTALFAVAVEGFALAQERGALREACFGDVRKPCTDVPRGGGRILKCLRSRQAELSQSCREALAAAKETR